MSLYRRWLAEHEHADFREYRNEAQANCSGLTSLWFDPFQAEYQAQDGSRALVRFRVKDGVIEHAIDVIPK